MPSSLPPIAINSNLVKKNVGENIEQLRQLKKKSVKEMASLLSLSQSAYRNIERGKTEPTITKILQIAAIFNVPHSQLLDFENKDQGNNAGTNILTTSLKPDTAGDKQLMRHYQEEILFLRKQNSALLANAQAS
jgi:transcriptional regulator with XRE-family HTH domain